MQRFYESGWRPSIGCSLCLLLLAAGIGSAQSSSEKPLEKILKQGETLYQQAVEKIDTEHAAKLEGLSQRYRSGLEKLRDHYRENA
ncbi:MAG: hypothetical protein AAF492_08945, partial [Verrucomicrobiota bacterium]